MKWPILLLLASTSFAGTITSSGTGGSITSTFGGGGVITSAFASSGGGGGTDTIAFDSSTQITTPSGASSPVSWNMTLGSSADMCLFVGCSTAFGVGNVSVTVGGNAMTLSTHTFTSDPYETFWFYKANPGSGSKAIQVSWDFGGSDHRMLCGAISLSGVSQTTPVDISTGSYSGNGNSTATVTTVAANDALLGIVNDNGASTQIGSPTLGTIRVFMGDVPDNYALYITTRAATTAGSYSDQWGSLGGPVQESFIAVKPGP